MTAPLRRLPDLNLDQSDVNPIATAAVPGRRSEQWFVFAEYAAGEAYWRASWNRFDRDGNPPAAIVQVLMPNLMAGSPDSIRSDITAAVERHATRHLGEV